VSATLILVNGHPGAGKTTLARWLGAELRIPCLTKDLFKEALYERLPPRDREASRELGRAAYDLVFAAAEAVLAAGASVILEAPLHREFTQTRLDALKVERGVEVVQVLLSASPAVLESRYIARQSSDDRHDGHEVGFTVEELRATIAAPIDPPAVDATLEVDTTDFALIDPPLILAWMEERAALD
jgi:predicted kinase